MRRYEALQRILHAVRDEPVVCNLGHPSQEIFAIQDRPANFYMLGSMGLATSIAHGISLCRKGPVIAIDGDASVTMNMGGLATIGHTRPKNLVQIIIDNRANGSTGFQPSFTAGALRLEEIARGAGITQVVVVEDEDEIAPTVRRALDSGDGPWVIVIRTEVGMPAGIGIIPLGSDEILERFMGALGA